MSEIKSIGVLTGGGDAPGLNAVIRAVVKTAVNVYGMQVFGIEDGYQGLIDPVKITQLNTSNVRGLLPRGGTILGTRNKGDFVLKRDGDKVIRPEGVFERAVENMRESGIDGLIAIGGEGTQGIAYEFHKMGVPIVGVPKTIDNDLGGTQVTFGFGTAVDIATEAIDRLHTTAESHDRVIVLEVMGRHAGWIATHAGIAGGADVILIPEIPFCMEKVASQVMERERQGRQFSIVVVAEGAFEEGCSPLYNASGQLSGIGYNVAKAIEKLTGKDTRLVVLGHLQRGGSPNSYDRLLATSLGCEAVHMMARGDFGKIVAYTGTDYAGVDMQQAIATLKTVPVDGFLVKVACNMGISFASARDVSSLLGVD